jgi:hypothetical protein
MNNNQTKKKMKGDDKLTRKKNKVCKNNKCVDKRTINDTIQKDTTIESDYFHKSFRKQKYLFYSIEDDTLYDTDKLLLYDKLKDTEGYLLTVSFRYEIDKDEKYKKMKIHTFRFDGIMYFYKFTDKEISDDPGWAEDSGITKETPYSFSLRTKDMKFEKENETVNSNIVKFDSSSFQEYINNIISEIKKKDLKKKLINSGVYKNTYKKLLYRFYTKCIRSNIDVFKIEYFA